MKCFLKHYIAYEYITLGDENDAYLSHKFVTNVKFSSERIVGYVCNCGSMTGGRPPEA